MTPHLGTSTRIGLVVALVSAVATSAVVSQERMSQTGHQAAILVHVTQGPEQPTRAALAFLVARTAIEEGHRVTLFLAGTAEMAPPSMLLRLSLEHDRMFTY